MNQKLCLLKDIINQSRENLAYLLSFNKPTTQSVVDCSQNLDKLIVEYERTIIENRKTKYKKAS